SGVEPAELWAKFPVTVIFVWALGHGAYHASAQPPRNPVPPLAFDRFSNAHPKWVPRLSVTDETLWAEFEAPSTPNRSTITEFAGGEKVPEVTVVPNGTAVTAGVELSIARAMALFLDRYWFPLGLSSLGCEIVQDCDLVIPDVSTLHLRVEEDRHRHLLKSHGEMHILADIGLDRGLIPALILILRLHQPVDTGAHKGRTHPQSPHQMQDHSGRNLLIHRERIQRESNGPVGLVLGVIHPPHDGQIVSQQILHSVRSAGHIVVNPEDVRGVVRQRLPDQIVPGLVDVGDGGELPLGLNASSLNTDPETLEG